MSHTEGQVGTELARALPWLPRELAGSYRSAPTGVAGRPRATERIGPTALIGLIALLGLGCSGAPELISGCEPSDGVTPICGFSNPEDLVPVDGDEWLIVSQGAPRAAGSGGSLVAFHIADERLERLYPLESEKSKRSVTHGWVEGWGARNCPGRPDSEQLAPHGIDLARGDSGRPTLAMINHGSREAVELFVVGKKDARLTLNWRGCIPIPPDVFANDVVLLPDGGLAITKMMPAASGLGQLLTMVKLQFGADTGSVMQWTLEGGWIEIENSQGSGPNGIEISSDNSELYFTEWGGERLVRIRLHARGSERRQSIDLPHRPDNLTWTRDGQLLVAGQKGSLSEIVACDGEGGSCAIPLSVLAIDPATLEAKIVLEHDGQAAGAASVALQVGDQLYLGSFAGDRVARVDYHP